jgi:predicted deacylase
MASYRIEYAPPDIGRYRAGNTGIDYATTFDSGVAGPHVLVNALTHGNEICGAVAVAALFESGVRPVRGKLTLCFANIAAYRGFDRANPAASRYVDEDFNRLWDASTLSGARRSSELTRARLLRALYASADLLLDIHSMQHATAPLMLVGIAPKGERLARKLGAPELLVRDRGHAAGSRLRDYAAFADEAQAATALLIECGQHWEQRAAEVARDVSWRFLAATGVLAEAKAAEILAHPAPPQRLVMVTEVITIASDDFRFAGDYLGLEIIPKAGTVIARDAGRDIRTPHDDCVLIMPSRRLARGQTAVRLGRFVD